MVDFVDRLAMTIQKAIDPSCYSTPKVAFNIEPKAPFRINQNVKLTCTVETLLTNVEVRILKDNEVAFVKRQTSNRSSTYCNHQVDWLH
uniref:Uncharacterized protein n=1 Tax=Romanomermis culicivorax TaxID=13658 RepID=A0A915J0X7_ROMCU